MGKMVTVPENALFLSFETMTTGLVFEISLPRAGSRAARYMSPLLIFIPSLQIGCFKLFCYKMTFFFASLISFLEDLLRFLMVNLLDPVLQGFGDELTSFPLPRQLVHLASKFLGNRNVHSNYTHNTPPNGLFLHTNNTSYYILCQPTYILVPPCALRYA